MNVLVTFTLSTLHSFVSLNQCQNKTKILTTHLFKVWLSKKLTRTLRVPTSKFCSRPSRPSHSHLENGSDDAKRDGGDGSEKDGDEFESD